MPSSATVDLADGEGRAPAPGLYDEVQVNPDPIPSRPRTFLVTSDTVLCARSLGRYRILEMHSDAAGLHVAADVEQRCRGGLETVYAAVRDQLESAARQRAVAEVERNLNRRSWGAGDLDRRRHQRGRPARYPLYSLQRLGGRLGDRPQLG